MAWTLLIERHIVFGLLVVKFPLIGLEEKRKRKYNYYEIQYINILEHIAWIILIVLMKLS